jgi:hypothetical protein
MRRAGGWSRLRIASVLLAAALLVLVLAQVFLPRIAASRISSRVGRYGSVQSVSVTAWPAIELLWGSADEVRVSAGDLALTPSQSAALLAQARGTASLDVTARSVREGSLLLRRARLRKRGSLLAGEGLVTAGDVAAALPAGVRIALLGSGGGRVAVRVGGGLFGLHGSLDAVAGPSGGRLVAHPRSGPLEGLRVTLFSDPRIRVEQVGASGVVEPPFAYRLTMTARLR